MGICKRWFLSVRGFTAVAALTAGCTATTIQARDSLQVTPKPSRATHTGSAESITSDEIAKISIDNAYQAVRQLRPMFLIGRVGKSGTPIPPCAIVAGGMPESLEVLKLVPAERVVDIQLLPAREAITMYGTTCPGGVLLVRVQTPKGGTDEGRD